MIDKGYTDAKTVSLALKEHQEVFSALPRIDHLFVPGGDLGHAPPKVFMEFVVEQAELLWRYHLQAIVWLLPLKFASSGKELRRSVVDQQSVQNHIT
ncbi:MAG: hypothetical protein SQA66_06860 [Candidatus Fervidibacter sacchari]